MLRNRLRLCANSRCLKLVLVLAAKRTYFQAINVIIPIRLSDREHFIFNAARELDDR